MEKEPTQNYLRYFLPLAVRAKKDDNKHEFTISDATLDRYGTIIPISAWNLDNFTRSGNFYYQHESSQWNKPDPDYVLGPARAWIEDDTLIGEGTYEPPDINELADKIRRKVDFGTLKATSVGFMPIRGHYGDKEKGEDPEIYYFDEVDLLEFSIVNIPANPNAVKRSFEEYIKHQAAPADIITDLPNPGDEGHPNDRTDHPHLEGGHVPLQVLKSRTWLTLHQLKNS